MPAPAHGAGRRARPVATLLLVVAVTALVVEIVRSSGPLLDFAFTSGVVTAALTALVTYVTPAVFVTLLAARLPVDGRVVLFAVTALVVVRLGIQALGEAIAAGADLGAVRYGVGLAGSSLAVAALVVVLVFASGVRPVPDGDALHPGGDDPSAGDPSTTSPGTPNLGTPNLGTANLGTATPGTAVPADDGASGSAPTAADDDRRPPVANGTLVAVGLALGACLAAGISLLLGTWDAYWRTGALGWAPTVLVAALAVAAAARTLRLAVAPGARGLWVVGPYLALVVMALANPAFLASQTGLPLTVAAGGLALGALLVALFVPGRAERTSGLRLGLGPWGDAALLVLAVAFVVFLGDPYGDEAPGGIPGWTLLVVLVALLPVATWQLARALSRPARPVTWLRTAGAASAVGLGLILVLLVYQVDYDIPLPFPNGAVPVAAALALALAGALAGHRRLRAARARSHVTRSAAAAEQGAGTSPLPDVTPDEGTTATAGSVPEATTAPEEEALPATETVQETVHEEDAVPAGPAAPWASAVAVLVAVVVGTGAYLVHVPTTTLEVADYPPGDVRVLNWNLHYGVSSVPAVELDEMVRVVEESGADVVTLQEVSRGWVLGGGADMATYLARELGMRYAFAPAADRQFGNAILWKTHRGELTDVARHTLPYGAGPQVRSAISGTIDAAGVPVRITSVHLQHREENHATRLAQLDALFAAEPVQGAYVLAGDLNSEPGWEEIEAVEARGLVSGQDAVGDPEQDTSPSVGPMYRIDWVFGSEQITFLDFTVLDSVASDHRAQVTTVRGVPDAP